MKAVLLFCLLASLLWSAIPVFADQPRIAIIIDDIGYNRERGLRSIALGDVTLAVIPKAPYARSLAENAHHSGRDVILHLPMSASLSDLLDPGGLRGDMSEEETATIINDAFERIPFAVGLNNHMGSELTADKKSMLRVMRALSRHDVFFIDSRTTPLTVAEQVANQSGLRSMGRDVFLDNERELLDINQQFNQLMAIARQRGYAIGIGHPYPETLAYLENVLPQLSEAGIRLVPVSELINEKPLPRARVAHRTTTTDNDKELKQRPSRAIRHLDQSD